MALFWLVERHIVRRRVAVCRGIAFHPLHIGIFLREPAIRADWILVWQLALWFLRRLELKIFWRPRVARERFWALPHSLSVGWLWLEKLLAGLRLGRWFRLGLGTGMVLWLGMGLGMAILGGLLDASLDIRLGPLVVRPLLVCPIAGV
jgi:hypothetical protein